MSRVIHPHEKTIEDISGKRCAIQNLVRYAELHKVRLYELIVRDGNHLFREVHTGDILPIMRLEGFGGNA